MFALFRRRNFALMWFGGLISLFGDRVLLAALPFYVYKLSGSTLATAIMVAAELIPRMLISSIAGVFVDRNDRKKIMVAAALAQAAIILPMLLVHSSETLWIVYVISFLQVTLAVFFEPAENALLPKLVDEDELLPANALNALNNNIARLVGPAVGGVVLSVWALTGVVIFDSITFLAAGLLILLIRLPKEATAPPIIEPKEFHIGGIRQFWKEWLDGVRLVGTDRVILWLSISLVIMNFGGNLISPLHAPFFVNVVGASSQAYGWTLTVQGVGGILGGLVAARIGKRWTLSHIYGFGMIAVGLLLFTQYNFPVLEVVIFTTFLIGLPAAVYGAAIQTLYQQKVPNEYLGRISGSLNAIISVVSLFGVLGFAGLMGDILGIVTVLNIAAAATVLAGMIALVFIPKT